jgi:hypothetical protein
MGKMRRWTTDEDHQFRMWAEVNVPPEVIATKLKRSIPALKARAYAIGLPLKWFRPKPLERVFR